MMGSTGDGAYLERWLTRPPPNAGDHHKKGHHHQNQSEHPNQHSCVHCNNEKGNPSDL